MPPTIPNLGLSSRSTFPEAFHSTRPSFWAEAITSEELELDSICPLLARFKVTLTEISSQAQALVQRNNLKSQALGFEGASIRSRGWRLVLEFGGSRATFERCTFRDCRIQGVMLHASPFRGCIFDKCDLERCDLRSVRFEGCTFTDTRVLRRSLQRAQFPEPGATRVEFEE